MPKPRKEYTAAEMVEAIEEAHGVIKDAADYLGCSRMTVYRYANEYVTVQRAIEKYRGQVVQEARSRMIELMRTPSHKDHYRALLKVLTVYDKEMDWSDKERREHSAPGGGPVTFQVVNHPPDPDE